MLPFHKLKKPERMYAVIPTNHKNHNGVSFPVVGLIDRGRDEMLSAAAERANGNMMALHLVPLSYSHAAPCANMTCVTYP